MKKSILVLSFVALANLLSCTSSNVEPLVSKPIPTEEQLTSSIAKMNEWQQLTSIQTEINSQMHDIIHNANPTFITKYRLLRDKYKSFPELIATTNEQDHAKFVLLWSELTKPIQDQLTQRNKLLVTLYSKTNSEFEITDKSFYNAIWRLRGAQTDINEPRARMSDTCEEYGSTMGYRWGVAFLAMGYSYGYAMDVAAECTIYYTDLCNSGGGGEWC